MHYTMLTLHAVFVTLHHYRTALSTALQLAPPVTAAESTELITTATAVVEQLSAAGKVIIQHVS
jgi:hypothetical protein